MSKGLIIFIIAIVLWIVLGCWAVASPLDSIYATADRNDDGELSLSEVSWFVVKTQEAFTYETNQTALSPEDFATLRAGDCEDWAIYVCDMLVSFDQDAFVAVIDSPTGYASHAICLWRVDEAVVGDLNYYLLEGYNTFGGTPLPDGYYLPIDYEAVGDVQYSASVWPTLRYLFVHSALYGRYM